MSTKKTTGPKPRHTAILAALPITATAACQSQPTPAGSVLLPPPQDGSQYRMTELCQHVRNSGYDVKGTLHHTFGPADFTGLLDAIPSPVRAPVENYLGNGLRVQAEIKGLCNTLGDE